MSSVETARRQMEICNACRYCEGYCAVFPAMMRKREFTDGDLTYFANLCHNCKGCFYACQYAPPHPFGVNVPQTLAELRAESYAQYAWPRPLAALYRRNGAVVCNVLWREKSPKLTPRAPNTQPSRMSPRVRGV